MLKGITVKLEVRTASGADGFGTQEYTPAWEDVDNVLVGEPLAEDANTVLNLYGKKVTYTLAVPKGDAHDWTDTRVRFFGHTFRTVGAPTEGIEELIPLSWNKKVRVALDE